MKKTRLVHVITRFDKGGSAENTFLTLAGLDQEAYEILLVMGLSHESEMGPQERVSVEGNLSLLRERGIRIEVLPELLRRLSPFYDVMAFVALWRLFRRERPEIVHTHTSKAGLLGRWAAWLAGVPLIVHTPHGHVFWGYFGPAKTRLFVLLERLSALLTDRLVMLTKQEGIDHIRFGIAAAEKFTTIHSGIDLGRFSARGPDGIETRKELGIPEEAFVVGSVGRLTAIKGHCVLIEAARKVIARHKNTVFVFLGAGELLEELRRQASEGGIANHVRFTGWQSDVGRIMSTYDLCAFPSLNEGMGRAIVEAMSMGIPIIASRIGGITDLMDDGVSGFLVPPADPEALADRIVYLMQHPERGRRMAKKALETVAEYGSGAMVRKIEDVYSDLLSRKVNRGVLACRPAKP